MTKIQVGERASITRTISQDDIQRFADLVGDSNPVHLDEAFASSTRFGRRIAHGMWPASLISAVLGTRLPGPGTIYLNQTLRFRAPVYAGDTVTAAVEVVELGDRGPKATLRTTCVNQNGEIVLEGDALVLIPG